jgi:hypothetical protein
LLALILLLPSVLAHAESGVVNASGTGHDAPEAISSLLRSTVLRYFKDQPQLTRDILQDEILPNASSFVQSYKIEDGSSASGVILSANIDLDIIHGLLSLTPANLGETNGANALVIVRGAKLPDSIISGLKSKTLLDPYAPLVEIAKERFSRRNFGLAEASAEDIQAIFSGEEGGIAEALKALGVKAKARVVFYVSARYETYDNENAHNKEERIVLSAELIDTKTGASLGRSSVNVVNPRSRKEQYVADLQRYVIDDSKDLFQDIFVSSGRKLGRQESHDDFSVVRVLYPSNPALVYRFKSLLETAPGISSVVEYSVKRGKFDFAVRPAMAAAALSNLVFALQAPDIAVSPAISLVNSGTLEAHTPAVSLKLEPKEVAPPADGGADENRNHRH